VLESAESACGRGAAVLGSVLGWGSGYCPDGESEARRLATATGAIANALAMSGCSAAEIGYVSCSANGSVANDGIEAQVLRELLGDRLGAVPIAVPAESFGNALAPSGVFQTIESLETARHGVLPPFRGAGEGQLVVSDLGFATEPRNCRFERALVLSCGMDGSVSVTILGLNR
jgi:act minimal PKS chain-length factor (CLF/KS beta)